MITMLLGIITLYSVPKLGREVTIEPPYSPPAVEVISVPPTAQPPDRVAPTSPSLPVASEDLDMDELLPLDLTFELMPLIDLGPPPIDDPVVFRIDQVGELPVPIDGYAGLMSRVVYPDIAREAGIEGKVTIEVVIGKNGMIQEAMILKGVPRTGLDESAMTAVMNTRFHPATQMGKPVPVRLAIPISFKLNK